MHNGSTSEESVFSGQSQSPQDGYSVKWMQSHVVEGVPACTPWSTETSGSCFTSTRQPCRRSLPNLGFVTTGPLSQLHPGIHENLTDVNFGTSGDFETHGLNKKRQRVMSTVGKVSSQDVHIPLSRVRARSRSVDFDITMKLAISVPIPRCNNCVNRPSSLSTITYDDDDMNLQRESRANSTTSLTGARRKRSE